MTNDNIIIKNNLKSLHTAITQLWSLSKANENCSNPKAKEMYEMGLTNNLQIIRDLLNGDQIFHTNISPRLQLLAMVVRGLNEKGGSR